MNARYYRQRELKKVSTPPTEEDMQKYYNMLNPRTVLTSADSIANSHPVCYLSAPNHIQRAANNCAECKFKHRCLG